MARLLAAVFRWLGRNLLLLAAIIAVLLVGNWLKSGWEAHRRLQGELEQQEMLLAGLRSDLQAIEDAIAADELEWRRQAAEKMRFLWREFDDVGARVRAADLELQRARTEYLDLNRQALAARRAANEARVELEALERATWWWDRYLNPRQLARLELARAEYAARDRLADAAEAARARTARSARAWHDQVAGLRKRQAALLADLSGPAATPSPRHATLVAARERKEEEITTASSLLASRRAEIAEDPRERLITMIRERLPLALGILVGILLLPVAIKAFCYFVLAPAASKLAPIRILPATDAPAPAPAQRSAVSVQLEIRPGEELLVQPDFLQSSSMPARKRTRWFLNPRLPFASLASGMFALTSVRPEGEATTRVVVSSQRDPFGEVGVVELPEGAAMVVHPRALAGIVKPAGKPTHITRHWRLGSLHAWLTLQLRYLVFHGPCQLILKGCRGVRVEAPQPAQPRLINQSATLGFSANLDYRCVRCETFIPYLRGQEALFNDLFAGGPGGFVYEEMPARGGRAGVTGRGLEGLVDAFLKALGI